MVQLSVLLLLSLRVVGRDFSLALLSDSSPSGSLAFFNGDNINSFDDLECSSFGASRCARALAGVFRAYGRDSSSIVFPRGRFAGGVRDKFRRETP